jgi:diketogulonate reductase-like aldo/keto reductase
VRLLKLSEQLSETPVLTNQVPYSVNDRSYVENGVLDYCQEHDILLTAYSPVDQGSFIVTKALRAVAEAHDAAPEQIALAWLVAQRRVITIPMSKNPQHQRENLDAAEIVLSESEMQQLR